MKKTIIFLLALAVCLTAAGCAKRQYASPGRADGTQPEEENSSGGGFLTRIFGGSDSSAPSGSAASAGTESAQPNDTQSGNAQSNDTHSDNTQSGGAQSENAQTGNTQPSGDTQSGTPSGNTSGGSTSQSGGSSSSGSTYIPEPGEVQEAINVDESIAPESVNSYEYKNGDKTAYIYYANDMDVTEKDGIAVVTRGNDALYVDYVGDEFDPVQDNPSMFLYTYGYEHILDMVGDRFGELTGGGENIQETAVQEGELARFEGAVNCGDDTVYIIAAIRTLDNGTDCVVSISVCSAATAMIFNNIEVH